MKETERKQIANLIKREVVPAIGCTEPIAVALCVAKATELLDIKPEKINALLSANILKNAMGVGIPGTGGMIGLPIAIALGSLIGKSEYELEVLRDCCPEAVAEGKSLIKSDVISIGLKENITEKLYIEISCSANGHSATAVIAGGHTNFVFLEKDGEVVLDKRSPAGGETAEDSQEVQLNFRKIYDFATTAPLDEISFILKARDLNKHAAEESFKKNYGHRLGKILMESNEENHVLGKNIFQRVISYTSAACDARMAGAMIPVMSNSGSGNQGITATLPVVIFAEDKGKSEEDLIRALTLSHLTAIYIKQSLGRLSALCGCVVASTGSCCGVTYLMGGTYEQCTYAVKNMVANITGMICDGAKPSCSLKVSSGVSTCLLSAILALENETVKSVEGIVDDSVDQSIKNMTRIGREGMNETDRLVLDIMTNKN